MNDWKRYKSRITFVILITIFGILLWPGLVPREHQSYSQLAKIVNVARVKNFRQLMAKEKLSQEEMGRILATILINHSIVNLNLPEERRKPLFYDLRSALYELRELSLFLKDELRDYSIDIEYLNHHFDILERVMLREGETNFNDAPNLAQRREEMKQNMDDRERYGEGEIIRVKTSEPKDDVEGKHKAVEVFKKKSLIDSPSGSNKELFREDENLKKHSKRVSPFEKLEDKREKTFYEVVKERREKNDPNVIIRRRDKRKPRKSLWEIMNPGTVEVTEHHSPSRGWRLVDMLCTDIPDSTWMVETNALIGGDGGHSKGLEYLGLIYSWNDVASSYFFFDWFDKDIYDKDEEFYSSHFSMKAGGKVALNFEKQNFERFRFTAGGDFEWFPGDDNFGNRLTAYLLSSFRATKWSKFQFLSNIKYLRRNRQQKLLPCWGLEAQVDELPMFISVEANKQFLEDNWLFNLGIRIIHRKLTYDLTLEDDADYGNQKVGLNFLYKFY